MSSLGSLRYWIAVLILLCVFLFASLPARAQSGFNRPPPTVDAARESLRSASAHVVSNPQIEAVLNGQTTLWTPGQTAPAHLTAGTWVTIVGSGFGAGPDVDYAKILVGNTRALERDIRIFKGAVNLLKSDYYETPTVTGIWPSELGQWTDTRIDFRVPSSATSGPLMIQVQKRIGSNDSLSGIGPLAIWDPLSERIRDSYGSLSDVISKLAPPSTSNEIPLEIENPGFAELASGGEAIFWSYDFNMGLTHFLRKQDWKSIMMGESVDPTTGKRADPTKLFGAIPAVSGEVPLVALSDHYFSPYPSTMPIKPLLRKPLSSGTTSPTGFVGYVYAESIHPVTQWKGNWIGFSCAACHSQRITYEAAPGKTVSKVFPGIPNTQWSMKWNVLSGMKGVIASEPGPDGDRGLVDKTNLLYAMPPGTGEHSLVRLSDDGSPYANDHLFSPIAIPIITRHLPVRRALSRPEMIAGFQGSYIHSEEPDGAVGPLRAKELEKLTAYLATLDRDDTLLNRIGMYRYLVRSGRLDQVDLVGESEFIRQGETGFPKLRDAIGRGKAVFDRKCLSCHQNNAGTWSDENMIPLTQVGTYFSPTIFHRETQSIRTSILRNLFWVEGRGLLHDGHVKSLEDLVSPARCQSGTALFNHYYTLNRETFHVPKGNQAQERALRRQAYFADVSWDTENLYWDYQSMRKQFGPREVGSKTVISIPEMPHPWCAGSSSEVGDLVRYLLTL